MDSCGQRYQGLGSVACAAAAFALTGQAVMAQVAVGTDLRCVLAEEDGTQRIEIDFTVTDTPPPAIDPDEPPRRVIVTARVDGVVVQGEPVNLADGEVRGFSIETDARSDLFGVSPALDGTPGFPARYSTVTGDVVRVFNGRCRVAP